MTLYGFALLIAVVVALVLRRLIRYIRMRRYFASEEFLQHKAGLAAVVQEHNEVASYADEIRERGLYELGESAIGAQAHLATSENTSQHNYRRDRVVSNFQAPNVRPSSLQIVRNARVDPLKYLMKYFDIKPTEERLRQVESLGEDISSLEGAVQNLHEREASITRSINPPVFILKHYGQRFMEQMGIQLSPIAIPYPTYVFQYVSAGGNSGQTTTIRINSPTIDALMDTMSEKIRHRKSAAGQRALMTMKLRNFIKDRDSYTCQSCSISVEDEPHLLLEVDHVMPVSKGGLSTPDNLQTLCWRCNRTKSNKILA